MRISLELVATEARKVGGKEIAEVLCDSSVHILDSKVEMIEAKGYHYLSDFYGNYNINSKNYNFLYIFH